MGERVQAEAAGAYLTDETGRLALAVGRDASRAPVRQRAAGPLARLVASERQPVLVPDLADPPQALREAEGVWPDPILEGARTAIGLPLIADAELVGVIVLGHGKPGAFGERELPLLSLLANQVTLAARNARAYLYGEELAIIEERSRIAREIHDGIAQSLAFTAIKLDLVGRLMGSEPERAQGELQAASAALREQIREVRRSIFALRPIDLEHHGFQETVRRYVSDFAAQNGLRATLELNGEPRLTSGDEVTLFRILQESLNNVAKHARARSVRVTVRSDGAGTRLTVEDDGRGFEPNSLTGVVSSAGGLGLTQMRERMETRGGRFTFESSPGNGTRVVASLPAA
jgi:signal transduction histidine kinase